MAASPSEKPAKGKKGAVDAAPDADQAEGLPARIRLLAPHGFIDEAGENRHWQQHQLVEDADTIALLAQRGAPFTAVSDGE